ELEATAPFIEQRYDDETALAVRSAITDAELFISYNMPAKALGPLTSALPKAPRDLRLNQKLAALHTRAGRFAEAAVCMRTLESIYSAAGHADDAARYADLASKYEERGGVASGTRKAKEASAPVQEFQVSAPVHEPDPETTQVTAETPAAPKSVTTPSGLFFHGAAPASVEPTPAAEFPQVAAQPQSATAEIDISSEWENDLSVEGAPASPDATPIMETAQVASSGQTGPTELAPVEASHSEAAAPSLDESIEEVRFYLGQGMTEQAEQLLAKLE